MTLATQLEESVRRFDAAYDDMGAARILADQGMSRLVFMRNNPSRSPSRDC